MQAQEKVSNRKKYIAKNWNFSKNCGETILTPSQLCVTLGCFFTILSMFLYDLANVILQGVLVTIQTVLMMLQSQIRRAQILFIYSGPSI